MLRKNGQLIPEDWSSTEYNNNNAWKFNMNNGNRNWNNKNNNNKYVRPVLAYLIKNNRSALFFYVMPTRIACQSEYKASLMRMTEG